MTLLLKGSEICTKWKQMENHEGNLGFLNENQL